MIGRRHRVNSSGSERLYRLFLVFYPAEFRNEYGGQMEQAFRDLRRDAARGRAGGALWRVWLRALADLARSAPAQRGQSFLKKIGGEKGLRTDARAIVCCSALIILSSALLGYGRSNGVSSLLALGRTLDAVASAGVFGNAIIFLTARLTRRRRVGLAYAVFFTLAALACLGAEVSGDAATGGGASGLALAYLAGCSFWCAVHRAAAER